MLTGLKKSKHIMFIKRIRRTNESIKFHKIIYSSQYVWSKNVLYSNKYSLSLTYIILAQYQKMIFA